MRDFGKVFSRIWESADFRALTEDGRTLVLYLLTCQHGTIAGAFRVPDGYACEDLQWSAERVAEAFANVLSKGFANRCETTKWVWVTKFLEWNPPENPNQRKAVAKMASLVPDSCGWKRAFMRVCGPLLGLEPEPEDKPLPNPLPTVPEPVVVAVVGAVAETGAVPEVSAAPTPAPSPAPTSAPTPAPAADAAAKRGRRLPADWKLPKDWGEWAAAKYPHWSADEVRAIAGKFRNFWVAKAGQDATKLDWRATWENWCDSGITQREHPPPRAAPSSRQTSIEARNAAVAKKLMEAHDASN